MTKTDLAKELGVKLPYIMRLARLGLVKYHKNGSVDMDASIAAIKASADPARAPFKKSNKNSTALGDGRITFEQVRIAKEAARAKLIQLEVKEREGELINAELFRQKMSAAAVAVKSRVRGLQNKLPLEIARIFKSVNREDIEAVRALLAKEHDDALTELSVWTQ